MLSRVADSLYWMSRYLERAENVARFVDVNLHLCLDLPGPEGEQWSPLVLASGHREDFSARYGEPTRDNVIRFLILDPDSPNSIHSCVARSRENARWIRQFITVEMWETLNRFYLEFRHAAGQRGTRWLTHDFLESVVSASQMFLGVMDATMSRGEGWHFCRMGRMLERADKTSRIL
ncbi:MAG: alpha-E domain-containing protein, partial [Thermodesulfobacteriota bacterium]|nr:alpha-E domain-containing protein [Thermodesulfobacteriota bacterium]